MITYKRQHGAALIVSLIILTLVTVIGVTGMQTASTELKMIASAKDRTVAFEAAESALVAIEKLLEAAPPNESNLYSTCSNNDCFNSTCGGGRCFAGEYIPGSERSHCSIADYQASKAPEFWKDTDLDVWNIANKHQTITVDGLNQPVKYIVEFMCYAKLNSEYDFGLNTETDNENYSENEMYMPLFRITTLAEGNAKRATVILQSTYKIVESS